MDPGPALPRGGMVVLAALLALVWQAMSPASARSGSPPSHCWTIRPIEGPALRCRALDGTLFDLPQDDGTRTPLHPALGWDLSGACWYDAREPAARAARGRWSDAGALMFRISGPGPSGGLVADGWARRCATEPATDPYARYAFELLDTADLMPARPATSPRRGVAGLESRMVFGIPPDVAYVAGHPEFAEAIRVKAEAVAARVSWEGGGATVRVPLDGTGVLLRHVYRRSGRYGPAVEIEWAGWWRVDWDPRWIPFSIGPLHRTFPYDVDEVVARLVE